jgi:hypothetical protein
MLAQHDPLRDVNWKWRLADEWAREGWAPPPRRGDRWLHDAVRFQKWLLSYEPLLESAPLVDRANVDPVADAFMIASQDDEPRLLIEAHLLTGELAASIADRLALPQETIEAFAALHFDVTSRLHATDYILCRACRRAGEPDDGHNAILRRFAYFGGPQILAAILEAEPAAFDAPQIASLDTAAGRRQARIQLAVLTAAAPFSPALIREIGRTAALIHRFESESATFEAAKSAYEAIVDSLIAASVTVPTDSIPADRSSATPAPGEADATGQPAVAVVDSEAA